MLSRRTAVLFCVGYALLDGLILDLREPLVPIRGFLEAMSCGKSGARGAFARRSGVMFGELHILCGESFFARW